jgi:signal transduction histidine kinase
VPVFASGSLAETVTSDRPQRVRHAISIALPIALLAFQAVVWWWVPNSPLRALSGFLCVAGMFVSGWIGGLAGGLLTTVASVAPLAWLLLVSPAHTVVRSPPNPAVTLPLFLGLGLLFSVFHERLRRAQHRSRVAESARQDLEHELVEALDEQMFLARIGETFATSLECRETIARIAQMSVEVLGDFLVINLLDGGTLRRLKVACSDPARMELARAFEKLPREQFQPRLVRGAIETRKTQRWSAATPDEVLRPDVTDPAVRRLFDAMGAKSILFVPLIARGETIGVMSVVSSQPGRHYGPGDVRLAEEIARRAALALDNVHLYQTAREAIAARDEVLGVVAHDLRNPLSAIELGARLIQHGLTDGTPADLERPVEAILRGADRANRLIEDLLDIRRAQAGRLELRRGDISPAALLFDVVETHRPLFAARDVVLELDRLSALPAISADRDRLLQVLDNLLGNALKFTPQGGRVTAGGRDDGSAVVFWVADTGPGLPADEVSHLFDRFWQAGEDDRRGLGIGLAIARQVVEAHGGEIWATSESGHGTIVSFAIPARRLTSPSSV